MLSQEEGELAAPPTEELTLRISIADLACIPRETVVRDTKSFHLFQAMLGLLIARKERRIFSFEPFTTL